MNSFETPHTVSRRRFLQASAGMAATAWTAPHFAIGAPVQERPHILLNGRSVSRRLHGLRGTPGRADTESG